MPAAALRIVVMLLPKAAPLADKFLNASVDSSTKLARKPSLDPITGSFVAKSDTDVPPAKNILPSSVKLVVMLLRLAPSVLPNVFANLFVCCVARLVAAADCEVAVVFVLVFAMPSVVALL